MSKEWIRCFFFALTVLLALAVLAEAERDFSCESTDGAKTQLKLKWLQGEASADLSTMGVEVKVSPRTLGPLEPVETKQSFRVDRAENEVVWESVRQGQDFFVVNSKTGSSVRRKPVEAGRRSYQFLVEKPSKSAERLVVELTMKSVPESGLDVSTGTAEVYLHSAEARHATFLGSIPVECRAQ